MFLGLIRSQMKGILQMIVVALGAWWRRMGTAGVWKSFCRSCFWTITYVRVNNPFFVKNSSISFHGFPLPHPLGEFQLAGKDVLNFIG